MQCYMKICQTFFFWGTIRDLRTSWGTDRTVQMYTICYSGNLKLIVVRIDGPLNHRQKSEDISFRHFARPDSGKIENY